MCHCPLFIISMAYFLMPNYILTFWLYYNNNKNYNNNINNNNNNYYYYYDKFTYLGSSVESTEKDIETRLTKAWTAINRLSIIWKSDLTDKMKRSFFQAAVTSILLYGCTTWTLTKRLENNWIHTFPKGISAMWNAISLVQDLNSCRCVHFLRR